MIKLNIDKRKNVTKWFKNVARAWQKKHVGG